MKDYHKSEWKEFSASVIELDGYKCTNCGRTNQEAILQVHHKKYIDGRKLWEYGTADCTTLCKGCHAAEHGHIKPKSGWQYVCDDDLGDLGRTCENCGTNIRYVFTIFHPKWGILEVGTLCCDNLTDTELASNKIESLKRYERRPAHFKSSKKWKYNGEVLEIRQGAFDIQVRQKEGLYYLTIHQLTSKKAYETLNSAKAAAFRAVESGDLVEYLIRRNIRIAEHRGKRKKTNKICYD